MGVWLAKQLFQCFADWGSWRSMWIQQERSWSSLRLRPMQQHQRNNKENVTEDIFFCGSNAGNSISGFGLLSPQIFIFYSHSKDSFLFHFLKSLYHTSHQHQQRPLEDVSGNAKWINYNQAEVSLDTNQSAMYSEYSVLSFICREN